MGTGFLQSGGGDAVELADLLKLSDRACAAVAERRPEAASELRHDGLHVARVGNHTLDALRNEILVGLVVLEVAGARTLAVLEGGHGAHAAIDHVLAAVGVDLLTRRLLRAGENRAEHNGIGACCESLRNIAGKLDAAVGDDRDAAAAKRFGRVIDGCKLRNANAANNARGADGARTNAHLDSVRAALGKCKGRLARGNVAGDDVNLREVLDDVLRHVHDALGVAMGGIDHHNVHAGLGELLDALNIALAAGDGGRNAKTVLVVAVESGTLVLHEALDIREAVEADDAPGLVHERQLAHLGRAHKLVCLLDGGGGRSGDGGDLHDVLELHRVHRREAHIGGRDHAHKLVVAVKDGEAVELKAHAFLLASEEADVVILVEADGRGDKAVQVVLYLGDLRGLLVLLEILVDDADAAGERHRNSHGSFCHGIHRRRNEGNLHRDAAREICLKRCIIRQKICILGHERDIIVRKAFERKGLHKGIHVLIHNSPRAGL